jgi:hypothetical protein
MNPALEINPMEDRLQQGFRLNCLRLKALERDAVLPLQQIRDFGRTHGDTTEWHQTWDQQWAEIAATLTRMETLFGEMDAAMEGTAPEYLVRAKAGWDSIQAEDQRLVISVNTVRNLAQSLDPLLSAEWNALARSIEALLELMLVCAQTLSIRLSLIQEPDAAEMKRQLQKVFTQLPTTPLAEDLDKVRYFLDYQKAITDLASHHHDELGFLDAIKALFLWGDSPEVQVAPDRSLQVTVEIAPGSVG